MECIHRRIHSKCLRVQLLLAPILNLLKLIQYGLKSFSVILIVLRVNTLKLSLNGKLFSNLNLLYLRRDHIILAGLAIAPFLISYLLYLFIDRSFEMVVVALWRLVQELGLLMLGQH